MPKYRKKPLVIDAVLWKGNNFIDLHDLGMEHINHDSLTDEITIFTLEGTMTAKKGDYIIKGIKGEFYPCKPSIFKKTYEIVEE
jgi:hypothetical protein